MKFTGYLSIILVLAILLPTMAGCADNSGNQPENAPQVSEQVSEVQETEPADPHIDSLPKDIDLEGETFTFLARYEEQAKNEIYTESTDGEVVNDAIYTRNINLKERLNCNIKVEELIHGADDGAVRVLENAISAGSGDYDLFCSNSFHTSASAYRGSFINLKAQNYIDLEKAYWSQGFNESASIGGKQYLATGTMSLGFYRYLMVELFNKTLFINHNMDFPYADVFNGSWTLEKQAGIASVFYDDINGDGVKDADDLYGFITRANNDTSINDGYWASLNLRTISKDDEGYYIFDADVDHFSTAIDNLFALMNSDGTYTNCKNDDVIYNHFADGYSAMSNARLYMVERATLRDMKDDYGILPMPKCDENQSSYYTLAQDQFLVYGIPMCADVSRLDDIALFLEAYASESYVTVKPAYYETALTVKYMNDEESVQVLDIVTNNMYIDPAIMYLTMFDVNVSTLRLLLASGNNNIASTLASKEKSMVKKIAKLNETYAAIEY